MMMEEEEKQAKLTTTQNQSVSRSQKKNMI